MLEDRSLGGLTIAQMTLIAVYGPDYRLDKAPLSGRSDGHFLPYRVPQRWCRTHPILTAILGDAPLQSSRDRCTPSPWGGPGLTSFCVHRGIEVSNGNKIWSMSGAQGSGDDDPVIAGNSLSSANALLNIAVPGNPFKSIENVSTSVGRMTGCAYVSFEHQWLRRTISSFATIYPGRPWPALTRLAPACPPPLPQVKKLYSLVFGVNPDVSPRR
jgi:hypothetical protein